MTWRDSLPPVRGKLLLDAPLAPFTWFRVGGPADALFLPADEDDLAGFLGGLGPEVSVTVLGVGSNVIVRDGGVEGVVIRLAGREFARVETKEAWLEAGAGALDAAVARAGAKAGIAGLEFYAGIPGTIGGALTMNAGCYGRETSEVLVEIRGVDRAGRRIAAKRADLGLAYRSGAAIPGVIWTTATFQGRSDDPAAIESRIAEITARRAATQPFREKTGGSTFKNPPGDSA
ncbi:MAG: FAD-binding protein, partial [Pseudomonadota bacterium]